MPQLIPSRFREENFRKYEKAIERICDVFPQVAVFTYDDYPWGINSCETFGCRLRDAFRSVVENGWHCNVPAEKLREVWLKIKVSLTKEGTILVGPAESLRVYQPSAIKPKVEPKTQGRVVLNPNVEGLKNMLQMLHRKEMAGPFTVVDANEDVKKLLAEAANNLDVFIKEEPNGSFTIL